MAGLRSLAAGIGTLISEKRSKAFLIELAPDTDLPVSAQAFQYFPESISDTKGVNWQTKEIPGGSLPVYQWTSSGERTISFTAQFSSDIDPFTGTEGQIVGDINRSVAASATVTGIKERLRNTGQAERNVDVRSAVIWLRQYMLPRYAKGRTLPPPKLILYLPQSGIGLAGGMSNVTSQNADQIVCVMTSCEVTWEKFFASGYARLASVSLSFAQIPQYQGIVSFPSVTAAMTSVTGEGGTAGGTNFLGYQSFFNNVLGKPIL